jgi:alpha-D-ribose 1-methylphosphonate 5-triphosphate synthase subunit PhnH
MADIGGELSAGFKDSVHDAQGVFRTIMQAFAYPAMARPFDPRLKPPGRLSAEAAAVLLTLADYDTPVWLDEGLSGCLATRGFLRFHCSCALTDEPSEAAFAIVSDGAQMPPLSVFAQGIAEYPDRSTTVILQAQDLSRRDWAFHGPGLKESAAFGFSPAPTDFLPQWKRNKSNFPLGVDLILVASREIAALPRSLNTGSR